MFHSVTARGVQGLLQTSILGVLASPVIRKRTFYFSRHGESIFNVVGRIGGDSDLSPRGKIYAESLARQFGGPGSKADSMKPRLVGFKIIFEFSWKFLYMKHFISGLDL